MKMVVMSGVVVMVVVVVMTLMRGAEANFLLPSPWGYKCVNQTCTKKLYDGISPLTSLNQCKLTCGAAGVLWPLPSAVTLGKEVVQFLPDKVTLLPSCQGEACDLLREAFGIFRDNLEHLNPSYRPKERKATWTVVTGHHLTPQDLVVKVVISSPDPRLTLSTNEGYQLLLSTAGGVTSATISAGTFYGARHGLETLTQLIEYMDSGYLGIVTSASIRDAPAYPYRGLLIDTSRNFISIAALKRTLDGMAANKLNTLHWHITDSHSFPVKLDSLPNMAYYGAYSPSQTYSPLQVKEVIRYAQVRGIRVLPEFDAPAHVGHGWEWGELQGLGKLAVCVAREPWQEYCVEPPCGQLNLANPNIYSVLGTLYKDLVNMFAPIDLFHYGGDEVNLNCWNTTDEITSWMIANGYGLNADAYYQQWSVFQERSRQLLTAANQGVEVPGILWTSHLTEAGRAHRFLNASQYIIQIWTTGADPLIAELLNKGYRVIFSNYDALYFDCGFGAWVGEGNNWCSPYIGWQKVYDNDPHAIALNLTGSKHVNLILGGEAALWTEQVDDSNMDTKLWPRASAMGERLWSNPSTGWRAAESRLIHHRQRLIQRGVPAERIQPQWCHQNEGLCYL
ncbi:chitooligosaccharidolytic beta-N-acetylglucosaminidase-like isoform X2 [Eriocheir sinensis]|nr:chitooligosaccharidolytic beta-N-acetylglucosaminidase-like isoform X2 [Eriocheir sinensis]XP_050693935.1 chitooligosaccharidolytic beta-N-acetylglucosaminidase-like isoform X2 [Eriocheir sinensis]